MPNYVIKDADGATVARVVADDPNSKPTSAEIVDDDYDYLTGWLSDAMKGDTGNSARALTVRFGHDLSLDIEGEEREDDGKPKDVMALVAEGRAALKAKTGGKDDAPVEKSDDDLFETEFSDTGVITKADEEQKIVYGWAYVTHDAEGNVVVDKSGEFVDDIREIEKTAVRFMLESRQGDIHHTNVKSTDIVESMVFAPDKMEAMGIAKGVLPSGWWIGAKCSDEVWEEYKAGRLKSFSIHGKGLRKAV